MRLGSVEYFRDVYKKIMATITQDALDKRFKFVAVDADSFKKEFEGDTDVFRKFCYNFAQSLMPGRVSSTLYSAVVSAVASKYNVDHKVMAGYCLLTSSAKYEEEKKKYMSTHKKGKDILVTHSYVQVGDKTYDYYGGFDKDVDHIDCVRIDEG